MNRVETILARYPGPVMLPASRLKWFGVCACGLGLVAACIALLYVRPSDFGPDDVLMTWLGLLFFAAVAIVGAVMMLPGAGGLTLRADGFEVRSLYRSHSVAWREASNFAVEEIGGRKTPFMRRPRMVAYDHAGSDGRAAGTRRRMAVHGALPDTYGLDYDDLAALMTQWRARALGQQV